MRHPVDSAVLIPLAPIAACIAMAWPTPSAAAEWKVTPGIELRETYTDNLRLSSAGSEEGDFVTEVTPRISLRGTGPRLKLDAEYAMRSFFYARTDGASNTHHHLQATANAELAENFLYVDARASAGQQAVSPFGPQVAGTGHLTGNQADVRTASISPYLRHRFGRIANAEVRYTRDTVSADTGGLRDSESDRMRIGIDSGSDFAVLQWNIVMDGQRIDYENGDNVETRMLTGSVRYLVSPRLALTATAGREDNSYAAIGKQPDGNFWSLGAIWTPSERSSIAAAAGKRFFGNTVSINAQHRTRMGVWSVGYQEDITTARSQFLVPTTQDTAAFLSGLWAGSIPDEAARHEIVQDFIAESNLPATMLLPTTAFTNRVFLQKSANASVAFRGAKNTLVFTLFRVEREPQSSAGADVSTMAADNLLGEATRQVGTSAVWNWHLSSRTSMTASAGFNRVRAEATGREDDNITARIGLSRQLQQKIKGGVELRHIEKRSSQSSQEFRENAITAYLQISF